jgi:hypothetical protein
VDGRFQTLSRLFDEIVELPIDGREAAILASCGEDQALESELRALIAADGRSGVHELLSEMVSAHAGALRKERALRPVEPRRRP